MQKLGVALTATAGGPSLASQAGHAATMETATPMPMLSSSEVQFGAVNLAAWCKNSEMSRGFNRWREGRERLTRWALDGWAIGY